MGLSKDVEEAIKANLSGQTAGVLKKYIEEHEQLVEDYGDLELEIESLKNTLTLIKGENTTLSSYRNRLKEIEKGETELSEKKIQFRIDSGIQEINEKHSNQRVEDHKAMFDTVFRNTVLRENKLKNVVESQYCTNYDNNSNPIATKISDMTVPVVDTKEITEE